MRNLMLVFFALAGFCKGLALLLAPDAIQSLPWDSSGAQLAVSAQAILAGLGILYASSASRLPRLVRGFGIYALCAGIAHGVMPAAMWSATISVSIGFAGDHPVIAAALSAVVSAVLLWSAVGPRSPEPVGAASLEAMGA